MSLLTSKQNQHHKLETQPIVKVTLKHSDTYCRYTDSDFDKVFIVLIFAGNNPKLFKFLLKTAYLYQEPWCDFLSYSC